MRSPLTLLFFRLNRLTSLSLSWQDECSNSSSSVIKVLKILNRRTKNKIKSHTHTHKKNPNKPLPLQTGQFQCPNPLGGSLLGSFQYLLVLLALGSTELDAVFLVRPHQVRVKVEEMEENNPSPSWMQLHFLTKHLVINCTRVQDETRNDRRA